MQKPNNTIIPSHIFRPDSQYTVVNMFQHTQNSIRVEYKEEKELSIKKEKMGRINQINHDHTNIISKNEDNISRMNKRNEPYIEKKENIPIKVKCFKPKFYENSHFYAIDAVPRDSMSSIIFD